MLARSSVAYRTGCVAAAALLVSGWPPGFSFAQWATGVEPLGVDGRATARIESLLAAPIDLRFDATPLRDVAQRIAELSGCTVLVDERELYHLELREGQVSVSGDFAHVTLASVLHHLLLPKELGFGISHGALVVSTKDAAEQMRYVRCYSVGRLVERWPPEVGWMPVQYPPVIVPGSSDRIDFINLFMGVRDSSADFLDQICTVVDWNTWESNGGDGSIAYFQPTGVLVVNQSWAVQVKLAALLRQMHAQMQTEDAASPAAESPARAR